MLITAELFRIRVLYPVNCEKYMKIWQIMPPPAHPRTPLGHPGTSSNDPVDSSDEPRNSSNDPRISPGDPVDSSDDPGTSSDEPGTSSGDPVESSDERVATLKSWMMPPKTMWLRNNIMLLTLIRASVKFCYRMSSCKHSVANNPFLLYELDAFSMTSDVIPPSFYPLVMSQKKIF